MWNEGHRVDWEGKKILESEPHYLKRRILEANKEVHGEIWAVALP